MEQSAGTDVSLSLFGGLCSQTASPLLLCIWLARMAKGKGYKCRVGASLHFLSSYAVSTAGRFLTLSLAIVLHGWCRCTVPSASIESADRRAVDLCTSRYVYVYCMYVYSVSANSGYPRCPFARKLYIVPVRLGWLAPARQ